MHHDAPHRPAAPTQPLDSFARRAAIACAIAGGLLILGLVFWTALPVVLLVFAGVLLAVVLRGLAGKVEEWTRLSSNWSLAIVVVCLLASTLLVGWFVGQRVVQQTDELAQRLPEALSRLRDSIRQWELGRKLLEETPPLDPSSRVAGRLFGTASGVFSSLFGVVGSVVFVLFLGLYGAIAPETYLRGLLWLLPRHHRPRGRDVANAIAQALRGWMAALSIDMLAVGVLTALGLWALGIPLALSLGVIAAVATFVPNFGPILSAIPAVLLGFLDGPVQALYVVLLYVGIQMLDSYILLPLLQRRAVSLPPGLTITAQLLLGVIAGPLGLILATPLTAAALAALRELDSESRTD